MKKPRSTDDTAIHGRPSDETRSAPAARTSPSHHFAATFIAEAHRFHAAVFADIKFRNRGVAADTNITQTFNIVLQNLTRHAAQQKTVRRDDRCFAHAIRFHACKRFFCAVIDFRCRLPLRKNAVLRGILPLFGKYRIIRKRFVKLHAGQRANIHFHQLRQFYDGQTVVQIYRFRRFIRAL